MKAKLWSITARAPQAMIVGSEITVMRDKKKMVNAQDIGEALKKGVTQTGDFQLQNTRIILYAQED